MTGRDRDLRLTDEDVYLFGEGRQLRAWDKLGSHPARREGREGTRFAVWAPAAASVSVIGPFNDWAPGTDPMTRRDDGSGIWEGFVAGVGPGTSYKYHVLSGVRSGFEVAKADPYAERSEAPPGAASIVGSPRHDWGDGEWMATRGERNRSDSPISIYEVHLGSWRRPGGGVPAADEIAGELASYVREQGFTHVELLPVMEHPYYGSWGYQVTGYFAASERYGGPEALMALVDALHREGIGVVFDWVPSHFVDDEHGLVYFDGTHLYEHADPRQGRHPEWGSALFNYGRGEVVSFLLSSAMYWLERYHADGLRVDAVASMLYLDYARSHGEWVPNVHGGRENLEAVRFLRELNDAVAEEHPDALTIAEESTAWPMVSRPTSIGGLGFSMKWDMGWMNDTLRYAAEDPIHRKYHHNLITFRGMYAFSERFCLPLSHDEVVHGKGSLASRMPGDGWEKLANLRLLLGYQWTQPGKKLLFMGGEIGQWREWSHDRELDWNLLESESHEGVQRWVRDLNRLMAEHPALHERDFEPTGFEWIDCSDADQSVVAYLRRGADPDDMVAVVCNWTPVLRSSYRIGVPRGGRWREVLNSDAASYGGGGAGNLGGVEASPLPMHGRPKSLTLVLPPLSVLVLEPEDGADEAAGVSRDEEVADEGAETGLAAGGKDGERRAESLPGG